MNLTIQNTKHAEKSEKLRTLKCKIILIISN